ncbi:hypothetical protein PAXRUDRAFT_36425 [Paxillus rubicundulus Ve08.2h10]|uniref:Helitron helicase-like domain-containing protein n=1 Tax=Paxillus rubicundulus Ve08.2h10 TaxID=930991 RepID=A0A0D0DMA9_9AGAM|nr:hypothetical protein PAXRUDRAFT_36425 [Paxillus rubicundulus Ve08.2h10]
MGMLEGQLMPQPALTLASVITVTYVSSKNHLKCGSNPHFILKSLPEDDIPTEISSVVWQESDDEIVLRESAGYVPTDTWEGNEAPDVIPLQFLGITNTELNKLPLDDITKYAVTNMGDKSKEGGYAVCHSHLPVSEFGSGRQGDPNPMINPLEAVYPTLFPYGIGGIEGDREKTIRFNEHIQWALQYHDCQFCTHHSFPFKHVFTAGGCVKGSDRMCSAYCGQIWGMSLKLCGPSLWITINPSHLHDPVAQILVGEEINMDQFFTCAGPDSNQQVRNIAQDPYATSKYFFFIIQTILTTLFGIMVTKNQVWSKMGLIGLLSGYFRVVEAQGQGTLHIHMLLWIKHTANISYIKANIHAHIDGFNEEIICMMPQEPQLAYSRPPNPDNASWDTEIVK